MGSWQAKQKGLRKVFFDGKEEGEVKLLGSVTPMSLGGYLAGSPDIEIEHSFGIKFSRRPGSECVSISAPVTCILIMEGERKPASRGGTHTTW